MQDGSYILFREWLAGNSKTRRALPFQIVNGNLVARTEEEYSIASDAITSTPASNVRRPIVQPIANVSNRPTMSKPSDPADNSLKTPVLNARRRNTHAPNNPGMSSTPKDQTFVNNDNSASRGRVRLPLTLGNNTPAQATLTALTGSVASSTQINIMWTGSNSYVVVTWNNGASTSGQQTGSSFQATGLSPNTAYVFTVTPYNSSNQAGTSYNVTKTTKATVASSTFGTATATTVPISWTGTYKHVVVTWSPGMGSSGAVTGTNYTASGLLASTNYTFTITPYNAENVVGDAYSAGSVLTAAATNTVTNANITEAYAAAYDAYTIRMLWSGTYSYVTVTWSGGSSNQQTGTTFSATGLTQNTLYTFTITPYNSDDTAGTPFILPNIRTLSLTLAPLITSVTMTPLSNTSVQLSWATNEEYSYATIWGITNPVNVTGSTYTLTNIPTLADYLVYVVLRRSDSTWVGMDSSKVRAQATDAIPSALYVNATVVKESYTNNIRLTWSGLFAGVEISYTAANGASSAAPVKTKGSIGYLWQMDGTADNTVITWSLRPYNQLGQYGPITTVAYTSDTTPVTTAVAPSSAAYAVTWTWTRLNVLYTHYRITWSDVLVEIGGVLDLGPGDSGDSGLIPLTSGTYTANNLTPSTDYFFKFTAYKADGTVGPIYGPASVRTLSLDGIADIYHYTTYWYLQFPEYYDPDSIEVRIEFLVGDNNYTSYVMQDLDNSIYNTVATNPAPTYSVFTFFSSFDTTYNLTFIPIAQDGTPGPSRQYPLYVNTKAHYEAGGI